MVYFYQQNQPITQISGLVSKIEKTTDESERVIRQLMKKDFKNALAAGQNLRQRLDKTLRTKKGSVMLVVKVRLRLIRQSHHDKTRSLAFQCKYQYKQYNFDSMSEAKDDAKSQGSRKSGKLHSAIEQAQAVQQRQQLRTMILDKFNKDFSKGNKSISKVIEEIVTQYFGKEKVTEQSLRALKEKVAKAVEEYRRDSKSEKTAKSTTSKQEIQQRNAEQKRSQVGPQKEHSRPQHHDEKRSQAPSQKSERKNEVQSSRSSKTSETSSIASKSVYHVEGDDDDQWATLVKFDTELFKKEKELERMREEEFKKKVKKELDKQLEEKGRKKAAEKQEEDEYFRLQQEQGKLYDQREREKREEYERKVQLEKQMRDKQVRDENKRKKHEKKKDDQLDQLLVEKIREEIVDEEQEFKDRKLKERQRFQQVMLENEDNQRRLRDEAERQRIQDTKAQQQYARLQDQLERKRFEEKQEREQKIKAVMASFADSVIKDQKEQIRAEDQKMVRHIDSQLRKQKQEEDRRKRIAEQQKAQMREYLAKQVDEKKQKEVDEKKIDTKQAQVWKEDTGAFLDNEKEKQEYLKGVYKKHEEVLLAQMKDKEEFKNRKKMNTLELLYNKALMKQAADQSENVKKAKV